MFSYGWGIFVCSIDPNRFLWFMPPFGVPSLCSLQSKKKNTNQRVEEYIPYAYHYNPLLIRKRSWILTIHKAKGHSTEMNFKKWVKSIQTAGYNGAHTVFEINTVENICCLTLHIALCILWGLYTVTLRLRAAAVMEAEDLSIYIDW